MDLGRCSASDFAYYQTMTKKIKKRIKEVRVKADTSYN